MKLLSPALANIMQSAAAGAFLSILMQPKVGWRSSSTIFAAGIVTAYFFAAPLSYLFASWTGANPIACMPVSGFTIGFVGMYACSMAISILQPLSRDPIRALSSAWRTWRTGGQE